MPHVPSRVLVLGADGMLGHKMCQQLAGHFTTFGTFRAPSGPVARHAAVFDGIHPLSGVNASDMDSVLRAVAVARPHVILNCIGVIKQVAAANDPIACITINALLPHRLAELCAVAGARLVHVSTDCVFSGKKGSYTEDDLPDAEDLYGRSKMMGEVNREGCLTIRTSIIGRELVRQTGLLEWFLSNRGGRVRGFANHIYTGFPTIVLAHIVRDIIADVPDLSGLHHVASAPIDKAELLCRIRDVLHLDIDVERVDVERLDRSLSAARFVAATGYSIPAWDAMLAEMAADPTPYAVLRAEPAQPAGAALGS